MAYHEHRNRECDALIRDIQYKQAELGYTSCAKFAEYLGICRSEIYRYYNKEVFPSDKTIQKICKRLDLTQDQYYIKII